MRKTPKEDSVFCLLRSANFAKYVAADAYYSDVWKYKIE